MSFSFGNTNNNNSGGSAPNKNLFGAPASSSGGPTTLFGTTTNNTTSAPSSGGLFSSAGGGTSNLFGAGVSSTPASKPGGLFGGGQATSGASSTPGMGFGGGFKKEGDASKPANTGLFSGAGASTGGAATSSGPSFGFGTSAATPAVNKTSLLPSTTPAGPPPGGLFGQNNQAGSTSSLFNTKPTTTTSSGPGLFGGATSGQTAAKPAFSLGGNQATSAAQDTSKPAGSLFSGIGSTTPSSTPAKPSPFSLGATTTGQQASSQATSSAQPAMSLGGTSAPPASSAGGASSGFSFGTTAASTAATTGATTTATSGAPTTTAPPALPAFPAPGGASSAPATSGATTSASTAPNVSSRPTGTEAPASSSNTTTQPASTSGATSGTSGNNAAQAGLAASTAGPAPSAQSRLKNKSMDEIITRWAADLSKYQKEFQAQAETVASWDRALVENSDKVRQLYSKTFQAERDAAEVERQLTIVEDNQNELDSYLDRYEKEIDNLMKMHGVNSKNETLRGPDQERERTYKLAEKLQDRLNELNKDLTEMIEEINNTSQTLSKTGKPDDPLTKVVRVLNTQLAQLQLIDSGASQLQQKIKEAQSETRSVGANGWNGLGSDPSADFMKSVRGGRASQRFGGVS